MNKNAKIAIIILSAIIVLLLGVVIVSAMNSGRSDNGDNKTIFSPQPTKEEVARANYVKANIDLYHALEGKYPYSEEDLIEKITEHGKSEGEESIIKEQIERMNEFDYSLRGDGKAYKFTYKTQGGQIETVEGNYSEEYR